MTGRKPVQTSLQGIANKAKRLRDYLPSGERLFAEASMFEEPGAGKPHAGICAGAVGQPAVLPRYEQRE